MDKESEIDEYFLELPSQEPEGKQKRQKWQFKIPEVTMMCLQTEDEIGTEAPEYIKKKWQPEQSLPLLPGGGSPLPCFLICKMGQLY